MTREPKSGPVHGGKEFVALLASILALQALGIDSMLPALTEMGEELGAGGGNRQQLIISAYFLGMAAGSMIFGFLSDQFGRKPVLMLGVSGYGLTSLGSMLVGDFDVLLGLRFVGGMFAASAGVTAQAIIRDRFEGDAMARITSIIMVVFMIVPVIAPTLGVGIIEVAGWRAIFGFLAAVAALVSVWAAWRLAETLPDHRRQPFHFGRVARNVKLIFANRDAIGYVFGAAFVMAGLYGYLNSAEQLLGEHFGLGKAFALVFGVMAFGMAVVSFVNSRIVERYGTRPLAHGATICAVFLGGAQFLAATYRPDSFALFFVLMAVNMSLYGFIGANFSATSMQPFSRIAGSASSVQNSLRLLAGAVLGGMIGAAYDGTARPLALSMFVLSIMAVLCVGYSERWRLFRRRADEIEQV